MKKRLEIIYQDDDILVVNKPAMMSVMHDRSGAKDVVSVLKTQISEDYDYQPVYRLDKDTSGILLVAKNRQAQSTYASMFDKGLINPIYLALVNGLVMKPEGVIKTPLSQDRENKRLMKINPRKGKPAVTEYRLLADYDLMSLLAVKPITGRTHQIRIHLKSINLPLAIDPLYGSDKPVLLSDFKANYRVTSGKEERPLIERLTLHAYQLDIPEVENRPAMSFAAQPDKKFIATIKMLTKHNPNGPEAFLNADDLEKITNGQTL